MGNLVPSAISFVKDNQGLGVLIVLVLAFCESFAFVSLLVPATVILFGVGGLIAAAEIKFCRFGSQRRRVRSQATG